MKIISIFLVATRYWTQQDKRLNAYEAAAQRMREIADTCVLIQDGDVSQLPEAGEEDCLVVVPMSGAVQKTVLEAAARYPFVCLFASCVRGNFESDLSREMLRLNASPTLMDSWAVLRRIHPHAFLATDMEELKTVKKVLGAYVYVTNARILLIGETEPWVISNSQSLSAYQERLGVEILQIGYEELIRYYEEVNVEETRYLIDHFKGQAETIVEPTDDDLYGSCRLAAALTNMLEAYQAEGAALACFRLIEVLKINSCLGVSYINDCTDRFVACEGDLDSAVTMLLMKKLSKDKLWMANPNIQPDETVNFVHCTAPLTVCGNQCRYTLRNHHETQVGVSPAVEFPVGERLTLCRVSKDASAMTVQGGNSVAGCHEDTCRTQMRVRLDDFHSYLDTVLGCHQVITFGDITKELAMLGNMLELER